MRRLVVEEPVTRAAVWARRAAWFAVAVTAIAVALLHLGLVEVPAGLAAFGAGLLIALAALACALYAFARIWTEGRRGLALAVRSLAIAIALLAWPGYLLARGAVLPTLSDLSTDIADPPAFSRSQAAYAARGGRLPDDPPKEARAGQLTAYPDIEPLELDMPAAQAFTLARRAAERRGFQIIEAVPPGGRSGNGRIEAVARSLVLRLPKDVTIRVKPLAEGSVVDIRSASRFGSRDFGDNASRIRKFLAELSALTGGTS